MLFQLVTPAAQFLASYTSALERGWSPDNIRGLATTREQLQEIADDPVAFVAGHDDPDGRLPPVLLPDGSRVTRLPSIRRWMWDGEFCGSIGLRWPRDGGELPAYVLGHIGYAVVPWKRGRSYATQALRLMTDEARRRGLAFVDITTDPENHVSQKVIAANGGVFVETFDAKAYGKQEYRYRIMF